MLEAVVPAELAGPVNSLIAFTARAGRCIQARPAVAALAVTAAVAGLAFYAAVELHKEAQPQKPRAVTPPPATGNRHGSH